MDNHKKVSCSCFCFLRRRSSSKQNKHLILDSPEKISSTEAIIPRNQDDNYSQNHSFLTTQKTCSQKLKSTIVAPSCRTPQLHNLIFPIPSTDTPDKKPNQELVVLSLPYPKSSDSIPSPCKAGVSSINKDKGLRLKPGQAKNLFFHDGSLEELKFQEDKLQLRNKSEDPDKKSSQNSKIIQEILNDLVSNPNRLEDCEDSQEQPLFCSASEASLSQSFEIVEEESKNNENADVNYPVFPEVVAIKPLAINNKSASDPISAVPRNKIVPRHNFANCESVFSPGLSVDENVLDCNKNSPHFEVSPIKSMISIDDYSDILAVLSNSEYPSRLTTAMIPDIFIRPSQTKPRLLPFLKPTTPHFFSNRSAVPRFRKDNRALIGDLHFQ